MKKLFLINFLLIISWGLAKGQDKTKPKDSYLSIVEETPVYPGGADVMLSFISKNLNRKDCNPGKIFISFVVDSAGFINNIKVVRGINAECDSEAVRVVKMMPQWQPGRYEGKNVNTNYIVPIIFD